MPIWKKSGKKAPTDLPGKPNSFIVRMHLPLKIFAALFLLIVFSLSAMAYAPQYSEEKPSLALRWKIGNIPISISSSLLKSNPNIRFGSDVSGAVKRSLETWQNVADIKFEELATEKQTISPTGNFGDGTSLITVAQTPENLLLFSKDAETVAARTRVFFNKKGFITEADIVLNPYQQFSTDGSLGTFDLQSVLTHEIGHLLGLEHSSLMASTMHESSGKNGIYNLPSFNSRTLAETDIAAIRAVYGVGSEEQNCCGIVNVKLSSNAGKSLKNFSIWAENFETGKISGEAKLNGEGFFVFEGIKAGKYRIYAQSPSNTKLPATADEIGTVEVTNGKTATLTKKINANQAEFELQYIGFNGQLSENPVLINGGKSFMIFIGGKNINFEDCKIGFNSPYISVAPKSFATHDFGENISVVSFEIQVSSEISTGEYSVFAESKNGQKSIIPGGLTVEEFVNNWSSGNVNE